ncbi:MAG: phage tail sheath family protein [Chloroflexi bacterium]|nr:phage tail sheath family protein [Chloroflexota bacterium]
MPEYLSPGVYMEEVDRGPKPIEGVGTAMACFVGFTEKAQLSERVSGDLVTRDLLNRPQLVTNWSQYAERFGGFVDGAYTPHAVYGYFLNGGSRCYVVSVRTIPRAQAALLGSDGKPQLLVRAKTAGFGGAKLRVSVTGATQVAAPAADKKPAAAKGKEGDGPDTPPAPAAPAAGGGGFTLTVERERSGGGWRAEETLKDIALGEVTREDGSKGIAVMYKDNRGSSLVDVIVPDNATAVASLYPREQSQTLSIEANLLPAPALSEFQGNVEERTGIEGLEELDDVTMVCVPDLMTSMPGQKLDLNMVKGVQTAMIAHCERMHDRVAIIDPPPGMSPQAIKKWRMDTAGYDSSYATLYYPWVEIMDPLTSQPRQIPPSGHMAGIWARSDNTRGVHKAPANEVVRGATGLAYNMTKGEQDTLNPNGVNCIRAFPGMGIRVWGARTLASNPSWRYLNVRRLFNFVEKSIERGTQWTVFEPNDQLLWGAIRRDVSNFLTVVWRDGALFGLAPGDAFYVKCDEELNPAASRDLGRLIIEIGIAPVKPAEFVIFRISQWSGPGA